MTTLAYTHMECDRTESLADFVVAEDDWISCEIPQAARPAEQYICLLEENARLAGCACYCLTPAGALRFRTDIPRPRQGDDIDIETAHGFAESSGDDFAVMLAAMLPAETGARPNLSQLCTDCGWPATERAGGRVAVDLEVRGAQSAIAVVDWSDTGLTVEVDLARQDDFRVAPPVCATALSVILLHLAGSIRMVRPVVREAGDVRTFALNVHVPPAAPEFYLPHAFAALSVAVGVCRAECRALLNPELARIYLKTRLSVSNDAKGD